MILLLDYHGVVMIIVFLTFNIKIFNTLTILNLIELNKYNLKESLF